MKRFLFFCLLFVSVMNVKAQCWKEVSAGFDCSAGIKTDGTLWIWGKLADINSVIIFNSPTPIQLGTATNWKTLSVGAHLMAIQSNGTLWGMGGNISGQLGNGTMINSPSLIQIGTATDWVSVFSGDESTLAIKSNGTLWGWGMNFSGRLGDGTTIGRVVPVQIGTDTDWKCASMGDGHTAAVKTNGTLWIWGSNVPGPASILGLGVGTFTNILPTQVGSDTDWDTVSVGYGHNLALKTNRTLWAWGGNSLGELGDGTNIDRYVPIQIGIATDWQTISAGFNNHSLALKTSGTLWTWGYNITGQLGNNTTINSNSPIQIGTATNWNRISAGGSPHSQAIRTDGSLWGWGRNAWSNIGDGTTVDKHYPVGILYSGAVVTASSASACAGSLVTLTASGAATYTWTGGVSNGVPFVPGASGNYTVTGSDINGCRDTAIVYVMVIPNATVTAHATATTICSGGAVTLTGTGGSVYSWSNGVADGVAFTPTATASYTVADISGCSNTASITVSVIPSPTVTVNSATICSGSNALLTASASPSVGITYGWSNSSTGNPVTVSPSTTASYTVTATNGGCSASAVASVSVVPVVVPVTGFSYTSPLCLTASNPLPTGAPGFSSGGIYSSGAGITTDPVTGQIDLTNSSAGTHVITYSIAANGCNPAGSSTVAITLNAPLPATTGFSYSSPVCLRDADPVPFLDPNFTNGGAFSGPGLALSSGSGVVDLSNTAPGTYTVTYSVSAANCMLAGSGTATLSIRANPSLSISSSTTIIAGEQATLAASSSANTYTWSPATGLSCSDCASPLASPSETMLYCVRTSDGLCTNSVCVTVTVESLCDGDKGFFLPNAFSPNGDGNNDVFCVQGRNRCVSNFQMIVYDRWGEKVFESSDLSACWDGTYKGKVLSPDVFVYYIKAQDKNQKEVIKKGNVTLIK